SSTAPAMAEAAMAAQVPPDEDGDECLPQYRHLLSPDLLAGQVAFITGGGSGIGFRIAELFMRHGCRTVIASRNLQRVAEASKKLVAATGQQCLPLSMDVRQPQTIVAAVDEALKEFKRIDILINGAAGNFLCPASALATQLVGTRLCCGLAGTALWEQPFPRPWYLPEHWFGSSLGSLMPRWNVLPQNSAPPEGHPTVQTDSLLPLSGGKFAEKSDQFSAIPLQRAGNKTEIAHSALYLASPLSSYVTGTTLVVDGGSWLTSPNSFSALMGIASSSA
ncbi:DECR2 reductase, partial [Leiothrix lutea]|nr:DECR2 reductase [Leiothrix lutea]